MRHPQEMGAPEVEVFLTTLATERRVSTSTHNQALSALLFFIPRGFEHGFSVDGRNQSACKQAPHTQRVNQG